MTTPTAPGFPGPLRRDDIAEAAKALGAAGGGAGSAQLLSLLYDPETDVDQVLRCLNSEPALAARVLKVANSPFYRQSGKVGTVERAVQVLGLSAIRGIAAAGCMDRMAMPNVGKALDPQRFRRHSTAAAAAAQALSQRCGAGVDAEAFMAGLLHDIGLVLLARLRPQSLAAVAAQPAVDAALSLRDEAEQIGASHTACGEILAEVWGLPGWLAKALGAHHTARPTGQRGLEALPQLLALADHAADQAGFGLWPLCALPPDPACATTLGLGETASREVADELPELLQRLALH